MTELLIVLACIALNAALAALGVAFVCASRDLYDEDDDRALAPAAAGRERQAEKRGDPSQVLRARR
jgi:hypothetical protein